MENGPPLNETTVGTKMECSGAQRAALTKARSTDGISTMRHHKHILCTTVVPTTFDDQRTFTWEARGSAVGFQSQCEDQKKFAITHYYCTIAICQSLGAVMVQTELVPSKTLDEWLRGRTLATLT